jgi:hypothetical protein
MPLPGFSWILFLCAYYLIQSDKNPLDLPFRKFIFEKIGLFKKICRVKGCSDINYSRIVLTLVLLIRDPGRTGGVHEEEKNARFKTFGAGENWFKICLQELQRFRKTSRTAQSQIRWPPAHHCPEPEKDSALSPPNFSSGPYARYLLPCHSE